mmetsp:Transcript_9927/g.28431  ORF Transcript_9927/g.28431 Transcript_9927/m.28431 type:complete len:93 (-) Transcript_9927:638-916(-)
MHHTPCFIAQGVRPEATLHVVRKIDRKSPTASYDAWQALLGRFEHSGVYQLGELYDTLDEKQRPEESCLDVFNRLMHERAQLGRVGEEVPNR